MMKTKFQKWIAALISFVMIGIIFSMLPMTSLTASAICCRKDGFDKSRYTLTGDMAKDVAAIAKSQKGRTGAQLGYTEAWCDEYVADCIENAGADSSIVGHGGTVADFESVMRKKGAVPVSSPQTGDLVFFTYSHVEIVTKVENGTVYCAGGNNGGTGNYKTNYCARERKLYATPRLYLRPNYIRDTEPPVISSISVTDVSTSGYTVNCTVTDNYIVSRVLFPTWTENNGQDDITWQAGTANGNTYTYRVSTNDHNNELGTYYCTHIYAYDLAGNQSSTVGANMYLSTEQPIIENIKIYDISKNGYMVSCDVTDKSGIDRVMFPTWTENNGQDDITWQAGTANGNTYTYYVNITEHNGELETYYFTHIYAYNVLGNCSSAAAPDIYLSTELPVIENINIYDVSKYGYTVSCKVTGKCEIDRVMFPTWTVNNGQDDIIWQPGIADGNVYTYRVNTVDHNNEIGQYYTHIYAHDKCGNESSAYAISEDVYSENKETGQGVYLEDTPPTISDVEIINITPISYTIRCVVEDDKSGINRVQFPTWTRENDQDDIQEAWDTNPNASGIIDGNIVTYTVYSKNHNNEKGAYATHIYAYDKCGNWTCFGIPDVTLSDYGDLNQDGNITLTDLIPLQKYLLCQATLTADQSTLADLNEDGMINVIDLMLLKRILLNP